MMKIQQVASVTLAALALSACGAKEPSEKEDSVESSEQALKACAVRCAEGYTLTPQCTCEVSSCTIVAKCAGGYTWDARRCRCVRDKGGASGESCGAVTCAAGDVCCNASCGICTPPGGFCTQQVCSPL